MLNYRLRFCRSVKVGKCYFPLFWSNIRVPTISINRKTSGNLMIRIFRVSSMFQIYAVLAHTKVKHLIQFIIHVDLSQLHECQFTHAENQENPISNFKRHIMLYRHQCKPRDALGLRFAGCTAGNVRCAGADPRSEESAADRRWSLLSGRRARADCHLTRNRLYRGRGRAEKTGLIIKQSPRFLNRSPRPRRAPLKYFSSRDFSSPTKYFSHSWQDASPWNGASVSTFGV